MKKIKLGFNEKAETQYLNDLQAKQIALQTLVDYLLEYVEEIDVNALYKAPNEYSIEIVANKFKEAYKGAKIEKIFDIIGFNTTKVERLCNEFKAVDIQINANTLEPLETIDFNIYAETDEQIKRYEAVKNICEAVKQINDMPIHFGSLIQAMRGLILADYQNQSIQPNLTYVLGGAKAIMPR